MEDTATLTHTAAGGGYASVSKDLAVTVTDNDTPGLVLSNSELAVTEGASASYTVKLATQPTAEVTVTVDGTAGTDLSVAENTLTFSATNWSSEQTVTASAGEDDDAVEDTATLTHTAAGGGYASVSKDLAVTVTDNDTPGLVLSKSELAVTEGASASYTVKLATQPTAEVTVTVTVTLDGTAGTDLSVAANTLTFSATNWSSEQTVTVSAGEDDDAMDDTATLTHTAAGGGYASVSKDLPVTVTDDDDQGITVEPTDLTLDAGETGTYEVTLTSKPTGPVTVAPMVTEDDISVAPPEVMFTTEDWDTPQIFTVTVGPDAEFSQRVILHSAQGADYESMEPESVTTRMSRKASPPQLPPSTSVALHVLPAEVPEEGGAATVQITATLDGAPRSDVTTVTVAVGSGTAQAGIDFAAVASFTVVIPANETRGAGTFALVPENDTLDEPDETVTVGGTTDAAELTVLGATLTVRDDDDPPRLTIADAEAAEGTREIVFHVRLERASGRQISVVCTSEDGTATAPDDYEPERGVLTLEPGQTAASIRLAVMDDTIAEPDETFRIVLSDPSNVELATATATGTILNDDANLSRMWLSRFGRAVATEVLDAVERRLVAAGGESTMSMAGHQVAAAGAEPDNPEPEFAVPTADGEARAMPFSELLAGSAFLVASGDASAAPGGWAGWAGWGRGGAAQFEGSERNASLSGELIGGIGGIDYDWGWLLAGVAVAHNVGRGEFSLPGTPERPARVLSVNSSLTSVHPYVRVAPADGVLLWGLLGYGLGSMDLADREADIGIEMKLAAYGARGAMLTPAATGGFGLDLKSDGFLVLMNTQEPAGEAVVDADASRVRLVLNGSLEVPLGLAGALSPSAEVGVRYDAGDAESGVGVELGGGVRYALPVWGLSVDAGARMLLAHQDRDYREWGARGSIHLDPGTPGRGLTLAVSTSRGAATTATEHLWSVGNAGELMRSDVVPPAGGRVNAEVGYALEVLGSTGVLTPSAELELNDSGGRIYRLGGSLIQGSAVSISMAGARTERPGAEPEYHLTLNTTLRW